MNKNNEATYFYLTCKPGGWVTLTDARGVYWGLFSTPSKAWSAAKILEYKYKYELKQIGPITNKPKLKQR